MKSLAISVSISVRLLAGVLAASVVASETAFAAAPQDVQDRQADAAPSHAALPGPTIVAPAGTVVPLTLVSQIKSKSTRIGDAVRAQVAFPVTAGGQVVIPAGTYVEGVVTSLTASAKKTHRPEVEINFVRLVYANGYVAALEGTSTQASKRAPDAAPMEQVSEAMLPPPALPGSHTVFYGGEGFTSGARLGQPPFGPYPYPTLPPLPPLPNPGPSKGLVIGLGVGIPVTLVVVGAIFGRHHRDNSDYVLYEAGWQFQMTLSAPLTVDAAQVSAAAAIAAQ
ncbi:MAG TPA: hypothetical protein VN612_09210 [Acidobacteriaceae bacterium]|nr:hypothetical protein [Acidobacteriaceae bacterium]